MGQRIILLRSNPVNPDPPVEKVAETLIQQGYQVKIVCWDREEKYPEKTEVITTANNYSIDCVCFGIPAVYGGGLKKTLKPLLTFQKSLKSWMKNHSTEYDIIHAFDFDTGFTAKKIAKKYNKKFVYHILDFYSDSHSVKGFLYNLIAKTEKNIINFADGTIICTEQRKEQLKGSKPKNLTIVHNTPKIEKNSSASKLKIKASEKVKIAYVGIFGQGRLLEELMQVVKQDDSLELHIGGYGALEETVKRFSENCKNIVYYGKLCYSDTLALERQCDVMTAIYDPTILNHKYSAPNKFYEALALNKPVIMVKNTGWDDVVENNNLGVIIEYSENGLKQGIQKLISEGMLRDTSKRRQELYKATYDWEIMKQRILALYESL